MPCACASGVSRAETIRSPATTIRSWTMSVGSVKGDSGGPIAANFAAMGYAFASNGVTTSYSTVDWSLLVLGYKPCRSAQNNPCT